MFTRGTPEWTDTSSEILMKKFNSNFNWQDR